jgi:hypothetical protein
MCDSATFRRVVDLVQAKRCEVAKEPIAWPHAATHVASTLSAFPDGITEAILHSTLPKKPGGEATASSVGAACTARHVRQDAVLKFALKAIAGPEHNLELVDAAATADDARCRHAPSMFLSRDKRLERLRGTPVLQPGRLLHATGCAVAESTPGGAGPLCMLPTPHLVLVLDAVADAGLIEAARQAPRLRGRAPHLPHHTTPIALRLTTVTPPEIYGGRTLRRLLLELDAPPVPPAPAAPPAPPAAAVGAVQEVEAELLLWDAALDLLRLLPPVESRPLLLLDQPQFLTSGSAEQGGAPAQLGLGIDMTTLVMLVDETTSAARRQDGQPPSAAAAAAAALAPGAAKASKHALPPPHALLGWLTEPPRCAAGSLSLVLADGHGAHQVELSTAADAGGPTAAAHSLGRTLRAGHHVLVTNLLRTPPAPLEGREPNGPDAASRPSAWRGQLAPSGWGSSRAAAAPGSAAKPSMLFNLSCLRAPLRSAPPVGVVPVPLAHAASHVATAHSLTCTARAVGWEVCPDGGRDDEMASQPAAGGGGAAGGGFADRASLLASSLRLRLLDGPVSLNCSVAAAAFEELACDATLDELAAMSEDARRQCLDAAFCAAAPERVWALTVDRPPRQNKSELWRINTSRANWCQVTPGGRH